MEIPGPASGIFRAPLATGTSANSQWQPGQLLQATVTGTETGKALLTIGNRQVIAETSLALQKGQQLSLLVRSLGSRPVLEVTTLAAEPAVAAAVRTLLPRQGSTSPLLANLGQLVRATASGATPVPPDVVEASRSLLTKLPQPATISTAHGMKEAFRKSGLFLESSLLRAAERTSSPVNFNTDLKANLLRLVKVVRDWPGATKTPADTRLAAANTNRATDGQSAPSSAPLPDRALKPGEVTPEQVRRLVRASGNTPPVERSTVATATARTAQLPAGLTDGPQQAAQTFTRSSVPPPFRGTIPVAQPAVRSGLELFDIDSMRTDLLRQIEATLSRLQMQQLATVPRDGERGLVEWLLDLPVRRGENIDLWSMRWYREPESAAGEKPGIQGWCVQLAFDLPGLGPMQALVQLQGEQVTTRFWTQQAQTLPLLRAHLGELRQALQAAGLKVAELDCHTGSIPATDTKPGKSFIREKA